MVTGNHIQKLYSISNDFKENELALLTYIEWVLDPGSDSCAPFFSNPWKWGRQRGLRRTEKARLLAGRTIWLHQEAEHWRQSDWRCEFLLADTHKRGQHLLPVIYWIQVPGSCYIVLVDFIFFFIGLNFLTTFFRNTSVLLVWGHGLLCKQNVTNRQHPLKIVKPLMFAHPSAQHVLMGIWMALAILELLSELSRDLRHNPLSLLLLWKRYFIFWRVFRFKPT